MSTNYSYLRNTIHKIIKNIKDAKGGDFVDILAASLILFIMPYEKIYKAGNKITLDNFDMSKINVTNQGGNLSNDDLFRKLRNGLAHFNIKKKSGAPSTIIIWDENSSGVHFQAEMKYKDFKEFVLHVGDENLKLLDSLERQGQFN